mgnify:CR=1 FL=1
MSRAAEVEILSGQEPSAVNRVSAAGICWRRRVRLHQARERPKASAAGVHQVHLLDGQDRRTHQPDRDRSRRPGGFPHRLNGVSRYCSAGAATTAAASAFEFTPGSAPMFQYARRVGEWISRTPERQRRAPPIRTHDRKVAACRFLVVRLPGDASTFVTRRASASGNSAPFSCQARFRMMEGFRALGRARRWE